MTNSNHGLAWETTSPPCDPPGRGGARFDRFTRSLQIRPTATNREYLRCLRLAELLAWERATPRARVAPRTMA